MNLRCLMMDYVDPQLKLSKAQRRQVRWRVQTMACADGIVAYLGRPRLSIFMPLAMIAPFLFVWIGISWIGRFTRKPFVAMALQELGYHVCERCGYQLCGLEHEARPCPECGAARDVYAAAL